MSPRRPGVWRLRRVGPTGLLRCPDRCSWVARAGEAVPVLLSRRQATPPPLEATCSPRRHTRGRRCLETQACAPHVHVRWTTTPSPARTRSSPQASCRGEDFVKTVAWQRKLRARQQLLGPRLSGRRREGWRRARQVRGGTAWTEGSSRRLSVKSRQTMFLAAVARASMIRNAQPCSARPSRPIPNTSEYVRIRADTLPKVPPPVGSFFTGQMLRETSHRPRAQTNHGTPQQQEALSLRQLTCRSGPSEDIMLRQDLPLRAFRHCPECRMPC